MIGFSSGHVDPGAGGIIALSINVNSRWFFSIPSMQLILLLGFFLVYLHLYSHGLLFPKLFHLLLRASPASNLDIPICHVTIRTVKQALKARLELSVVEVRIWMVWIEPGAAEIAKVCFALRTCHVVTSHALLAWY